MKKNKNLSLLLFAFSLVFLMGTLSYAAVPLYRLFCQVTGFGGTPQRTEASSPVVLDKEIIISFNADTNAALDWTFQPQQRQLTLKIGETGLAFYEVQNNSAQPVVGMSTYNVTPHQAGQYFHKLACFCFEEQLLKGQESQLLPIQFYIDPAIAEDPDLKDVRHITLSYTFFKAKSQELTRTLKTDMSALK